MWEVIKQLGHIASERAKFRKAMKQLANQQWSVDFIVYVLKKAFQLKNENVSIVIKNGQNELVLSMKSPVSQDFMSQEKQFDYEKEQAMLQAMQDLL